MPQGWRTSMEDAHCAELDVDGQGSAFFGVYDGLSPVVMLERFPSTAHHNEASCNKHGDYGIEEREKLTPHSCRACWYRCCDLYQPLLAQELHK